MILQSQVFRGNPKLEAAAISDPAHILPGAWGPHVGKIQMALIQLNGANIAEYELQRQAYGVSTAAAVLAYKRKRNIINFSYQTKADDIVGKMTIAALDREMKEREVVPSGPCRIVPLFPRPSYSLPQSAWRLRLGFKVPFAGALPPSDPFPHATISPFILELAPNQTASFRAENGFGKELRCFDPTIAIVKDIHAPFNSPPDRIPITGNRQDFRVFPQSVGRTLFFINPPAVSNLG